MGRDRIRAVHGAVQVRRQCTELLQQDSAAPGESQSGGLQGREGVDACRGAEDRTMCMHASAEFRSSPTSTPPETRLNQHGLANHT